MSWSYHFGIRRIIGIGSQRYRRVVPRQYRSIHRGYRRHAHGRVDQMEGGPGYIYRAILVWHNVANQSQDPIVETGGLFTRHIHVTHEPV